MVFKEHGSSVSWRTKTLERFFLRRSCWSACTTPRGAFSFCSVAWVAGLACRWCGRCSVVVRLTVRGARRRLFRWSLVHKLETQLPCLLVQRLDLFLPHFRFVRFLRLPHVRHAVLQGI